jgi:hypothetical protein
MKPAQLAKEVLESLAKDEYQIPVGEAGGLVESSCSDFQKAFDDMNHWG